MLHCQYASHTGPVPSEMRVHVCGGEAGLVAAR